MKTTLITLKEARKTVRYYWDVNNQLPEEEKKMPLIDWLYYKGYRLMKVER